MKKITIVISIAAFLLFCALALVFFGKGWLPKEAVFDQTNKTFLVKGDVKIKKAEGGSGWQRMETSTVLEKGDAVETAAGSSVEIIIGRNTDRAIEIKENSRVEFREINPTSLDLPEGEIQALVRKLEPKSSFKVKTPTAICGVKGTGWAVAAKPDKTRVSVFENEIFVQELAPSGKPRMKQHIAAAGTQRTIPKDESISEAEKIGEGDLQSWEYWSKNMVFLREGKILVNDFDRKENFNNLGGVFGSWNVFYSDQQQYCKDELTDQERAGDKGYGLKLTYDVDTPFSAYNGFFTKLMDIDVSEYKYLVFHIKGDRVAGYTTKINVELKSKTLTGRAAADGITDEWKKTVIPLDKFAGISSFKDMSELVIVFSDINVTKKEGIVYIDDIYFSKTEPDDQ